MLTAGCTFAPIVASSLRVQGFPAAGSCHVHGHGLYVLPDRSCTPGARNRQVTQTTIDQTICEAGWTQTIRPPVSITEPEKRAALAAYGDYAGQRLSTYELDHLLPLELGGAPNRPANLWVEPNYPRAHGYHLNPKDQVEAALRRRVCAGEMSLRRAQSLILTNWISAHHRYR